MKKNSFDPKIRLEVREERLWTAYLIHLSMLDWDSFMCWEQQEVLEICLDLLEMCIFMDSVRRRFFVPCVHWSYLEWHFGVSGQDMWSVQPMSSLHWSLFRVSDTLLHLPDGNDRVYGARHGGNCNLSSNDCGSDLRMSRFSGGYVSGHPCILSSGGCGIGNGWEWVKLYDLFIDDRTFSVFIRSRII